MIIPPHQLNNSSGVHKVIALPGITASNWTTVNVSTESFHAKTIDERLKTIENRLAIIVPDIQQIQKYEALKQAYDEYKAVEALCYGK